MYTHFVIYLYKIITYNLFLIYIIVITIGLNIGGAAVPDSKAISGSRKVSSRRQDFDSDEEQ